MSQPRRESALPTDHSICDRYEGVPITSVTMDLPSAMSRRVDGLVGGGQCKLLSTIAETKSFGKAALALGVTQPSVSQSVRRLETIFGRPLFLRSSRGVKLTEHGEAVMMYMRVIQALIEDLQRYRDDVEMHARNSAANDRGAGVPAHAQRTALRLEEINRDAIDTAS